MSKRVAIFAPYGSWLIHHQVDAVLGAALMQRGCHVQAVRCDSVFKDCPLAGRPPQSDACRRCSEIGQTLFARFQIPSVTLSGLLMPADWKLCTEWSQSIPTKGLFESRFDGNPIGQWVYASLCQALLSGRPDWNDARTEKIYRELVLNGALVSRAAKAYIEGYRPDHAICYSAIAGHYRVFAECCKAAGIPFLSHERGTLDDSFGFCINGNEWQPAGRPQAWEQWRDVPLTRPECEELSKYIAQREQGRNLNRPAYYTPGESHSEVRSRLAIPSGARIVAIFPNSDWELGMSRVDVHRSFDSSSEAIRTIIRNSRLKDYYFVIRLHPNMVGRSHLDQFFLQELIQIGRELPENFRMVMPKEKLTSYDLAWHCDAAFTFGSTIGPETLLRGVGVATIVDKVYSMIDMGIDKCCNLDQFDQSVLAAIDRTQRFGIEDLRRVWRGFHFLFFKLAFRFKSFGIKNIFEPDLRLKSLDDLRPGQDPVLDRVCHHIMEGDNLFPVPSERIDSESGDQETEFLERELSSIRQRRRQAGRDSSLSQNPLPSIKVVRVRRDGRYAPDDPVFARSLHHVRHRDRLQVCEAAFPMDTDASRLLGELVCAVSNAPCDYVAVGSDWIHWDESFIVDAIEELHLREKSHLAAVLSGAWVCDQRGTITGELFTERSDIDEWVGLKRVCPWIIDPAVVLGLFVWRKNALLNLLHHCDSADGLEATAQRIFQTTMATQGSWPVKKTLIPAVVLYPPPDPAALAVQGFASLSQKRYAEACRYFTDSSALKYRDGLLTCAWAQALAALDKPWQAMAMLESIPEGAIEDQNRKDLRAQLKHQLSRRPICFDDVADAVGTVHSELVPGQDRFLFEKVRSLPQDARILEIGAYHGRSTVALAFACVDSGRRVTSIDTFGGMDNGGTKLGGGSFQDVWTANVQRLGLQKYVRVVPGLSHEILSSWDKRSQFDFVFIDASHHFVDVLRDFELVYPMIKDDGWIAFHDVEPGWPGPWRVWCETARPLLADHVQVSTLACGRKVAGRELILPAPGIRFAYAAHWASTLRAALPELCRAMQASLEGTGDPDSLEQAEGVIARMPTTAWRTLVEMLKLEAAEDPYLHFWQALVQFEAGDLDAAHSALENAACGAEEPLQCRMAVWRERLVAPPIALPAEDAAPADRQTNSTPVVAAAPDDSPRILFCTTYYDGFLAQHYRQQADLSRESYAVQIKSLLATSFGDSDFYSNAIADFGWQATDVVVNCEPLQQRWAREQGVAGNAAAVLLARVRHCRPDVFYLHDMSLGTRELLEALRPFVRLIVGQIACPLAPQTHLAGFDVIFSSFPHFVDRFRRQGLAAYYQPLAFDSRVMFRIGAPSRDLPVTFIGGLSGHHTKGGRLLEYLAERTPIQFWGYGSAQLPADSKVRRAHHGEAWGLDMFHLLARSRITVNRHIDVAENYANNMRLFEATGCGALLVTDYKDNLGDLFEIGKEVVAYRSPEECAALIQYYLAHPQEAEAIAQAGRLRTLRDHGYGQRMAQTAEILERHLRYRREKDRYPMPASISSAYRPIASDEVSEGLAKAWQDESIPARQRGLVQSELAAMYKGRPAQVYQVLADALRNRLGVTDRLLEIGCASGYYYEVLSYLLNRPIRYTGVDYSHPLIAMAKDFYPQTQFHVADGAALPYTDNAFDVVVSSCVLLHVTNFEAHIAETARVAGRWVVVHRTPVCRRRPTQYMTKAAYGVETVELRFNEQQLLNCFQNCGLSLRSNLFYSSNPDTDSYEATYVFEKSKEGVALRTDEGEQIMPTARAGNVAPTHNQNAAAAGTMALGDALLEAILQGKINLDDAVWHRIIQHPEILGLKDDDLIGLEPSQHRELIIGEFFAKVAGSAGRLASELLFKVQWGYAQPDWFDHRHHILDPQKRFNDYWTASADNVISVLPLGGTLLELCSGDGFYDYHFYRHRAAKIICVDINPACHRQALRCHQAPNIQYLLSDVLSYTPQVGAFDVVAIRGAIEHFNQDNQQQIFLKASQALKPRGWFCGDTVAALPTANKQLDAHEAEWVDEAEMRRELGKVFNHVETRALTSKDRVTLLWRCRN